MAANEVLTDQVPAEKIDDRDAYNDLEHTQRENEDLNRDVERGSSTTEKVNNVEEKAVDPRDPNLVDWDGPDDPENPLNWTTGRKAMMTTSIALITFLTPLGSSMFAPGVPDVMLDFHSSNESLAAFIVSVYLLGYCFGPLAIAPLSEMYGRQPLYTACNLLYTIFNVACAVAPEIGSLIVFRFFAGVAGSCPLTLGAGSLADMIPQNKRGAVMAIWAMGPLLGPVIGPVAGGYLTQAKGWRWTFWVLAIAVNAHPLLTPQMVVDLMLINDQGGAVTISSLFTLRESYAYTLLDRKTKRLRKETGNPNLRSVLDTGRSPKELFLFSIVRPTKMLFLSPIVFLLSLYTAVIYGYLYLLFTTMTDVFETQYNFSQGSVGLAYLGVGVGSFIGLFLLGAISDRLQQRLTTSNGGVPKPEYRLPPMFVGSWLIPVALFWYGWTAEKKDAWILPIIGTAFLGIGMIIAFMATSTYLVDAYTVYAASAMAAYTLLRSLLGALLPLAGGKMYQTLGLGWGNSLLGFIALALAPIPLLFYKYGERIRNSKLFKVEF
ncbi:hypothetical protein TCE0_047f17904 [Talaromyces pinophilus]|uniref:Major facilitator superfamily (MFS) profile domain-containing protein n=1 Tax=Talaromyces pinophilus TaxID=128442 RepID=A0A0B8N6M3_TALPI|nr:hypothetical protein TCE0_047f17904 [Talaromyces pinophilus]